MTHNGKRLYAGDQIFVFFTNILQLISKIDLINHPCNIAKLFRRSTIFQRSFKLCKLVHSGKSTDSVSRFGQILQVYKSLAIFWQFISFLAKC